MASIGSNGIETEQDPIKFNFFLNTADCQYRSCLITHLTKEAFANLRLASRNCRQQLDTFRFEKKTSSKDYSVERSVMFRLLGNDNSYRDLLNGWKLFYQYLNFHAMEADNYFSKFPRTEALSKTLASCARTKPPELYPGLYEEYQLADDETVFLQKDQVKKIKGQRSTSELLFVKQEGLAFFSLENIQEKGAVFSGDRTLSFALDGSGERCETIKPNYHENGSMASCEKLIESFAQDSEIIKEVSKKPKYRENGTLESCPQKVIFYKDGPVKSFKKIQYYENGKMAFCERIEEVSSNGEKSILHDCYYDLKGILEDFRAYSFISPQTSADHPPSSNQETAELENPNVHKRKRVYGVQKETVEEEERPRKLV